MMLITIFLLYLIHIVIKIVHGKMIIFSADLDGYLGDQTWPLFQRGCCGALEGFTPADAAARAAANAAADGSGRDCAPACGFAGDGDWAVGFAGDTTPSAGGGFESRRENERTCPATVPVARAAAASGGGGFESRREADAARTCPATMPATREP